MIQNRYQLFFYYFFSSDNLTIGSTSRLTSATVWGALRGNRFSLFRLKLTNFKFVETSIRILYIMATYYFTVDATQITNHGYYHEKKSKERKEFFLNLMIIIPQTMAS